MLARGALAALVLLALVARAAAAEPPQRIVSFNLCADQLVLALADPGQIAGLSRYAADPWLSVVAGKARGFPLLDWQAESVVPIKPDLVLVGSWDRPATRRMLGRLGIPTAQIELVADYDAARAQVRSVAELLGRRERGAELEHELERAHARLAAMARVPRRTAVVVERGGFTAGPQTLAATLLRAAGFDPPPGSPQGFGGFVPLERLITLNSDILVVKDRPSAPEDQGAVYLTHPALNALYPPRRRIDLPVRFTLCGGPALVAAFDYLADALERMPR